MKIHGQIGFFPFAGDPKAFEFFTLDRDPFICKGAAFLTEIHHRHVVFVAPLLAIAFFNFPLDWQAVAIPTGHIKRVMTHHLMAAHNHIF